MKRRPIKEAVWYPYAAAICIAVVLYIILSRFPSIWAGIKTFIGYFRPVIYGCVIAYVVNPFAKFISRNIFKGIKKESVRMLLSNALAFIIVIFVIVLAFVLLVPQIARSIETFAANLQGYIETFTRLLARFRFTNIRDMSDVVALSGDILERISKYINENMGNILSMTVVAGKTIVAWVIAFILAIYMLANKNSLKKGFKRLLRALFGVERYPGIRTYLIRCHGIFKRYITFNIIDAIIIGLINFAFMKICGMEYGSLISFVVGITNLIPTFGPVVGGVIGAFILLMVKPMFGLIFIIFTIILQTFDGYVLKPKLFGNSMGISGFWILLAIVVGANMFGVVGILIAIPMMGIIDFSYKDYFMPWLEKKRGITKEE